MDEYEIRYVAAADEAPSVHVQKGSSAANAVALFRIAHRTGKIKRVLKRVPREEWQEADRLGRQAS